jgi:hypothetical protein
MQNHASTKLSYYIEGENPISLTGKIMKIGKTPLYL